MDAFSLVTITIYVKWTQRCVSGVGMGRYGYEGASKTRSSILQYASILDIICCQLFRMYSKSTGIKKRYEFFFNIPSI